MVLEVAILQVKSDQTAAFESAFTNATPIIATSKGYINHTLKKCIEKPNKYVLLVNWETLADHEIGFRQSEGYQKWKALLHHFYNPFPIVEHYQ